MILAGGKSSRMGEDKAMISIEGIPLIRQIHDTIAECQSDSQSLTRNIYIVTPWVAKYQSTLPATCQFILETQPHQGPIIGFEQGLSQIESTWVLLLACDLPNLSTSVIRSWIDKLSEVAPETSAYLPRNPHGKGWEPLCGFYRRSCLESLGEYINAGGNSFQGWLAANDVTELMVPDRQILFNCNTPADLSAVIQCRSQSSSEQSEIGCE